MFVILLVILNDYTVQSTSGTWRVRISPSWGAVPCLVYIILLFLVYSFFANLSACACVFFALPRDPRPNFLPSRPASLYCPTLLHPHIHRNATITWVSNRRCNQHIPPGILLGLSSSSNGIKDSNGQTNKSMVNLCYAEVAGVRAVKVRPYMAVEFLNPLGRGGKPSDIPVPGLVFASVT